MVKMISGEPPRMPMSGGPLTAEEVRLIRSWISQGATDDTPAGKESAAIWWSLKPISRPTVAPTNDPWIRTPIDAFILAKLKEKGLMPSPEADRRAWRNLNVVADQAQRIRNVELEIEAEPVPGVQ